MERYRCWNGLSHDLGGFIGLKRKMSLAPERHLYNIKDFISYKSLKSTQIVVQTSFS